MARIRQSSSKGLSDLFLLISLSVDREGDKRYDDDINSTDKSIMKKQDKRWHTNPDLWEKLKPLAHEKRQKPTKAEKALWEKLRMHRLHGLKFRSQHTLGPFIVDFYCRDANLVIEVDGAIHRYKVEEDKIKQQFLKDEEYTVLRFSNEIVLNNIDEVVRLIESSLPGTL